MCGRFTLTKPFEDLRRVLGDLELPDAPPPRRYNIAPSQPIAIVVRDPKPRLTFAEWGLIPHWARDPSIGSRLINARAETVSSKPAFQASFRYRRCLIPASGFYEWHAASPKAPKRPVYIHMRDDQLFAMAGLWDHWQGDDGTERITATILTTTPNRLLRPIHNRMPVILPRPTWGTWLAPEIYGGPDLHALLAPYAAEEMEYRPVSTRVNNPGNDDSTCLDPPPKDASPGQLELF